MSVRLFALLTSILTVLALVGPAVHAPDVRAGQPRSEVRSARITLLPVDVSSPDGPAATGSDPVTGEPTPAIEPTPTATPSVPTASPSASPASVDDPSSPTSTSTPNPGPERSRTLDEPDPAGSTGDNSVEVDDLLSDDVPAPVAIDPAEEQSGDPVADGRGQDDLEFHDGLGAAGMDAEDVATQSDEIPLDDAMLVGATWTSEARVEVRSGRAGDWSEWVPLVRDPDEHAPDPGSDEWDGARAGVAEPVFVGGADEVQFRSDDLSRVQATFVDTVGGEGVSWTPESTNSAAAADAAPRVRTRADWGANESWRDGRVGYSSTGAVRFSVVHHVGAGHWSADEIANGCARSDDWIRSIYAYHTQSHGWWDIGYNFIVDPCGTIWEGRSGGIDKPVDGAHAGGFNDGSVGVLALGTFSGADADPITSAMVNSIERIVAWKLQLDQVSPSGRSDEVSGGGSARWPSGTRVTLPILSAHQVSNTTSCPGDALMSRLFTGSGSAGNPRMAYVRDVRDRINFVPEGFYPREEHVDGTYEPLSGDFNGDGRDDVLWYGRGRGRDMLWTARADQQFTSMLLSVKGVYEPLVGDFDGNGSDDVFWYGPGAYQDRLWLGSPSGFRDRVESVHGTYRPAVGDFDRNGRDDILWYAPGSTRDTLWMSLSTGFATNRPVRQVRGTYTPLVGAFDDRRGDDVIWYGRGSRPDRRWSSDGDGTFQSLPERIDGTYVPVVGDFDHNGRGDVLWYGPDGRDSLWYHDSSGRVRVAGARIGDLGQRPASGDFDGADGVDLLFHRPGSAVDVLWWRR